MRNENITDIIKIALTKSESARNNDKELYLIVMETLSPGITKEEFGEVMLKLNELGLPCYDTVTRLRRMVQSVHPELRACDKVQDYRSALEEKCRREFTGVST